MKRLRLSVLVLVKTKALYEERWVFILAAVPLWQFKNQRKKFAE
jgi:hypothetical protein